MRELPNEDAYVSVVFLGGPERVYDEDAARAHAGAQLQAHALGFAPPKPAPVEPLLWEGDNA